MQSNHATRRIDVIQQHVNPTNHCTFNVEQQLLRSEGCSQTMTSNRVVTSVTSYDSLRKFLQMPSDRLLDVATRENWYSWTKDDDLIQTELIHSCLVITLNRPKAYNALTFEMIVKVTLLLAVTMQDDRVTHLIIRSKHPKVFCAGGDVKALNQIVQAKEFFAAEYNMNRMLYRNPKPVIALLNGITMGGGAGISMYCPYRVGHATNFVFAMPENQLGLFADIGATWFLPNFAPAFSVASYISLTGDRFYAADCKFANLLTHVLTPTESKSFDGLINVLTHQISGSRSSIEQALDTYCDTNANDFAQQSFLAKNYAFIERVFSQMNIADVMTSLKEERSQQGEKIHKIIATHSPTSVSVTLEALKRGYHGTLEEKLISDFRVAQRMVQRSDFFEGVRAILINKDGVATFNPPSLDQISPDDILSLFDTPLDKELQFADIRF